MLTGKPPFQSSTAEEIYRRAREREYDWPKLDTSENYICQEAKDLVSSLLVDPEDRPDPDTIVRHPFFSCGWVPRPEEMLPKLKESPPSPNHFLPAGLRTGRANLYAKNLKKLCIMSDVGPYCSSKKIPSSTYREVAAEEKAGLTPAVPLPENVVYRPFDEWLNEQVQRMKNEPASNTKSTNTTESEETESSHSVARPTSTAHRSGQQSFAAQQRAQNQPASASMMSQAQRLRPSPVNDQQSQKLYQSAESGSHAQRTLEILTKQSKTASGVQGSLVPKAVAAIEARIGTDLVQQLNQATLERQTQEEVQPTASTKPLSLFSERESPEFMPRSKPEQILQSLKSFHAELERALNSRSIPQTSRPPVSSPAIVVKWVDYTNKFGLGYILSNGSVGCIFRSSLAAAGSRTGRIPPTCVIVRNAERHLQSRGNETYPNRHQLVPVSGPPIEFYENRREEGIARVSVNPRKFSVITSKDGESGKLSRGKDEYDDRKCEKIVLWNKFAKYMTAFGRDQDYPHDDALQRTPDEPGSGTVITFYQRFGDVGCWNFNDGSFQVST
jgi:serine/threonine protein kinase